MPVWIGLKLHLRLQFHFSFFSSSSSSFFLFSRILGSNVATVHWTIAAKVDFSTMNSAFVHCLQTHKFHFLTTFSLKMSLTILFTHLKIILLQCFQFSIFSKISDIQTNRKSRLGWRCSLSALCAIRPILGQAGLILPQIWNSLHWESGTTSSHKKSLEKHLEVITA